MPRPRSERLTCGELAQQVTVYLEGALAASDRDRFEAHCRDCSPCRVYVAQTKSLVGLLGAVEDRSTRPTTEEKEKLVALFREHGMHRPGRPLPRVPLGLDAELAAPGDHIVYFCTSEQDFRNMVGFVVAGAERGETCILLGHDDANSRLDCAVKEAGVDVATLRREDRLHFFAGRKSAEALFDQLAEQIIAAVDRGAPLVRILGNLGWGRPDWPIDRDLLRLEARLTDAVRKLPVVVICAYDIRDVPGPNLLLGGLECHPLTFHRNALRPNPLFRNP